ncbi:MAG: hypothetical protein LUQ54_05935 [Methanoregula sp.]|nr:hypothetical protein [Methanoregula sp.]
MDSIIQVNIEEAILSTSPWLAAARISLPDNPHDFSCFSTKFPAIFRRLMHS